MSRFADLLNAAMEKAGLTASGVAESAGLTESAISLLRSGRREPSYRTLQRLTPSLSRRSAISWPVRDDPFDSIEDAIADVRAGKMVVVLDDEDRENEGDLVMAAQMVTPDAINFMRKHAGGLICVPMVGRRLDELHIPQMVRDNTAVHETAFTVSVEARGLTTTGISAHDRAATIKRLLDPEAHAADFLRPGHTFPLRARDGGVLVRAGQTEAAIDLARLAGLYPGRRHLRDHGRRRHDGTVRRLAQLRRPPRTQAHHRKGFDRLSNAHREARFPDRRVSSCRRRWALGAASPTRRRIDDNTHVALVMGEVGDGKDILVRVHSECMTGDALHSIRCDCSAQRDAAMSLIAQRRPRRLPLLAPGRPRHRSGQ